MQSPSDVGAASEIEAIDYLRAEMPAAGLFKDKEWHLSHAPFAISREVSASLKALGPRLRDFSEACNRLYLESAAEVRFPWVAQLLDAGKPEAVVAAGREARLRDQLPQVIRPDIILTGDGFRITELDPLPGGIGLTAWLNAVYARLGWEVIGGAGGMIEGFAGVLAGGDVLISRESQDYQPEMEWITDEISRRGHAGGDGDGDGDGGSRVLETRDYKEHSGKDRIYRFFEMWDLDNVEHSAEMLARAREGTLEMTPPPKAFLEEKMWLSLFWSPGLAEYWEEALASEVLETLRGVFPFGWIVDPEPLPHFAEYPRLGIHDWSELGAFSQKQRQFALKVSGFSEKSWGSRGVSIGHDLPQEEWKAALRGALESFPVNPFVLQDFHTGRRVLHPYYDAAHGGITEMDGRVRLSPYYFLKGREVTLGGILATICSADKKLIHGMKDAVIVPCREDDEE